MPKQLCIKTNRWLWQWLTTRQLQETMASCLFWKITSLRSSHIRLNIFLKIYSIVQAPKVKKKLPLPLMQGIQRVLKTEIHAPLHWDASMQEELQSTHSKPFIVTPSITSHRYIPFIRFGWPPAHWNYTLVFSSSCILLNNAALYIFISMRNRQLLITIL